jgi:hypothetical protein
VNRFLRPAEGFLRDNRFLILDRDTKSTAQFPRILEEVGVTVVNTAVQAPNMNSIGERWTSTLATGRFTRRKPTTRHRSSTPSQ